MYALSNHTPFQTAVLIAPDERRVDTLSLLVRACFDISPAVKLADSQLPVPMVDEWWGEPGQSSLRYPSQMLPAKLSTDILVNATAWSPAGRAVSELDVGVAVGHVSKRLRVFGKRVWHRGEIRAIEPFSRLPLVYEHAYGGVYNGRGDSGDVLGQRFPFNPVGLGYTGDAPDQRDELDWEGIELPRIEDPEALIQSPLDQPLPAGFAAIAGDWLGRRQHAGTYDQGWLETRSPLLPSDFDPRFYSLSNPALTCPGFLQGGEYVQLVNLCAQGRLCFHLPLVEYTILFRFDDRNELGQRRLETVLIEPEENRLSLIWRCQARLGNRGIALRQIVLAGGELPL